MNLLAWNFPLLSLFSLTTATALIEYRSPGPTSTGIDRTWSSPFLITSFQIICLEIVYQIFIIAIVHVCFFTCFPSPPSSPSALPNSTPNLSAHCGLATPALQSTFRRTVCFRLD